MTVHVDLSFYITDLPVLFTWDAAINGMYNIMWYLLLLEPLDLMDALGRNRLSTIGVYNVKCTCRPAS